MKFLDCKNTKNLMLINTIYQTQNTDPPAHTQPPLGFAPFLEAAGVMSKDLQDLGRRSVTRS